MTEQSGIAIPQPATYSHGELEALTEILRQVNVLANECPGFWITNGTLELAVASDMGPAEYAGMIRIHTDNQENIVVAFQPVEHAWEGR